MTGNSEGRFVNQSWKRRLASCVLVLCVALLGLAAGTFLGGQIMVPPGAGLAGPAEALMWGVLSAFVFGAIAVPLSFRMSTRNLKRSTLIAFTVVVLTMGALSLRGMYVNGQAESEFSTAPSPAPTQPVNSK